MMNRLDGNATPNLLELAGGAGNSGLSGPAFSPCSDEADQIELSPCGDEASDA
jgi:hypothetical protein